MAANPKPPVVPVAGRTSSVKPYHVYHAEAHLLSGFLKHPVDQPIEHGRVTLKNRRSDHIMETVQPYSLEGLIRVEAGHTRASGSQIKKKDLWGRDHSGWVTLSTSVIEGLNVFEVITADRMVAQVSTEHLMPSSSDSNNGYPSHVPKVTFLGTRFENLQVAGYPVQLELDLAVCGEKPEGDRRYVDDPAFLDRVQRQLEDIARTKGLPEVLEEQYDKRITYINDLKKRAKDSADGDGNGFPKIECSLIKSIAPIPIPGVQIFGNVIFIPDFGTVALAEVEVGVEADHGDSADQNGGTEKKPSNYFTLHMLDMRLGCIGGGSFKAGGVKSNGTTQP